MNCMQLHRSPLLHQGVGSIVPVDAQHQPPGEIMMGRAAVPLAKLGCGAYCLLLSFAIRNYYLWVTSERNGNLALMRACKIYKTTQDKEKWHCDKETFCRTCKEKRWAVWRCLNVTRCDKLAFWANVFASSCSFLKGEVWIAFEYSGSTRIGKTKELRGTKMLPSQIVKCYYGNMM